MKNRMRFCLAVASVTSLALLPYSAEARNIGTPPTPLSAEELAVLETFAERFVFQNEHIDYKQTFHHTIKAPLGMNGVQPRRIFFNDKGLYIHTFSSTHENIEQGYFVRPAAEDFPKLEGYTYTPLNSRVATYIINFSN